MSKSGKKQQPFWLGLVVVIGAEYLFETDTFAAELLPP